MKIDPYSLAKAGLRETDIEKIAASPDEQKQIRMLQKYRFRLLDEIHGKQQSLDTIDYILSRMREHA